jgi:hypothetical protein
MISKPFAHKTLYPLIPIFENYFLMIATDRLIDFFRVTRIVERELGNIPVR